MSVVSRLELMGRQVRTRQEWGTRYEDIYQWRRLHLPVALPVPYAFGHITVTFDSGSLTGDFGQDMKTIERIGYERFGTGISYTWGVDAITGMIGEGMPVDAKGAHTINEKMVDGYPYNLNYHGHAIAVIGMPGVVPSAECIKSMGAILRASWDEGVMDYYAPFLPHNKFAAKACPTPNIENVMDDARRIAIDWNPFMALSEEDKNWFRSTMRTIIQETASKEAYADGVGRLVRIPNLLTPTPPGEQPDNMALSTAISRIYPNSFHAAGDKGIE